MAGLEGVTREHAQSILDALGRERAGYELRKTVAKEEGDNGLVAKFDRRLKEVAEQEAIYKKLTKSAPSGAEEGEG